MTAFHSPRRPARARARTDDASRRRRRARSHEHTGRESLQEKRTLVETSADVTSFTCVAAHRSCPARILTGFPFAALWSARTRVRTIGATHCLAFKLPLRTE